MDKENIRQHLLEIKDDKYREFHSRLVPGEDLIIGVRIPVLRKYARELMNRHEGAVDGLISSIGDEYYEEIVLRGMIIGLEKNPDKTWLFSQIDDFVPRIKNWGVCDVFCGGLKAVKKYKTETYEFLQQYIDSHKEFDKRFGIVMLLSYYIDDEYVDDVLKRVERIRHEGYYVKMAVAWLISICFVKFYDKTKAFMEECEIDDFTYNKALQKARESYRITDEQKEELNLMKRKQR